MASVRTTCGLFLALFLIGLGLNFSAVWERVYEILALNAPYWATDRGFGYPLPLGDVKVAYSLNPIYLLSEFMGGWIGLRHLSGILSLAVFWLCLREMRVRPCIAFVAVLTFAGCAPFIRAVQFDPFFERTLPVTMAPFLVFFLLKIHQSQETTRRYIWALIWSFVVAVAYLSSHPTVFYAYALAISTMILTLCFHDRSLVKVFAVCAVLVVVATLWKNVFLISQLPYFGGSVARGGLAGTSLQDIWAMLFKPFFGPQIGAMADAYSADGVVGVVRSLAGDYWHYNNNAPEFMGGPVFVVALAVTGLRALRLQDPFQKALCIACAVTFLCSFTPKSWHFDIPNSNLYFLWASGVLGILAAARALETVMASGVAGYKLGVWATLFQALFVLAGSVPFIVQKSQLPSRMDAYNTREPIPALAKVLGIEPGYLFDQPEPDFGQLAKFVAGEARRSIQPRVCRLYERKAAYLYSWEYGFSDFCYSTFMVSNDVFAPVEHLENTAVAYEPEALLDSMTLDVIGLNYLVVDKGVHVDPSLREIDSKTRYRGATRSIYKNPGAWPVANLMDPSVRGLRPLPRPGCPHDRIMCADFGAFSKLRQAREPTFVQDGGVLNITFKASSAPSVLYLSQMYRAGWQALDGKGRALSLYPLFKGFVGIDVPAGTTEVIAFYEPLRTVVARLVTAWGILALVFACAGGIVWLFRNPPKDIHADEPHLSDGEVPLLSQLFVGYKPALGLISVSVAAAAAISFLAYWVAFEFLGAATGGFVAEKVPFIIFCTVAVLPALIWWGRHVWTVTKALM